MGILGPLCTCKYTLTAFVMWSYNLDWGDTRVEIQGVWIATTVGEGTHGSQIEAQVSERPGLPIPFGNDGIQSRDARHGVATEREGGLFQCREQQDGLERGKEAVGNGTVDVSFERGEILSISFSIIQCGEEDRKMISFP